VTDGKLQSSERLLKTMPEVFSKAALLFTLSAVAREAIVPDCEFQLQSRSLSPFRGRDAAGQ